MIDLPKVPVKTLIEDFGELNEFSDFTGLSPLSSEASNNFAPLSRRQRAERVAVIDVLAEEMDRAVREQKMAAPFVQAAVGVRMLAVDVLVRHQQRITP